MIWINFAGKSPTDTDIPNWKPWTQERWHEWLERSEQLLTELAALNAAGRREERNDLMERNSAHWGKLKEWLLALSNGKCWFSEVRELYSHYDVEHFRPKKEAKELDGTERDGYWWLAFDYTNFRLCGNVGNRKKGGWFPLKDTSLRSVYESRCEESETPYLLDPIDAADVLLIAFNEEGKVIPAPGTSTWEEERVKETITRLKLNEHTILAEERRKIWQQVDGLIEKYKMAKSRCGAGNNPVAREQLTNTVKQLREKIKPSAELSAVARWCLLFRNDPQLSQLLS